MNFFQITLAICLLQLITSAENQGTFPLELFTRIAAENNNAKNIIISPASIQTVLALAYIGAEGKTADELKQVLDLGNSSVNKIQVAERFANLMNKMRNSTEATVKMANRIYVRNDLQLASTFNDVAKRYYNSKADRVNFSEKGKTAKKINNWVKKQTENKIQNLISSDSIDAQTAVILVNALYFKAKWSNPFSFTTKKTFHVSKFKTEKVDMMFQEDLFAYGELPHLHAKALSMKYKGTDIQMLILLPNELDGLARMELTFGFDDLTSFIPKLRVKNVRLTLPKFKFEFDVSLKSTLEALHIHELFRSSADLSGLLTNSDNIFVTDVLHKAFIEVNENGTVAAGASALQMWTDSMPPKAVRFNVDHPFFFALMDSDTVYFAGHVANI